MARSIFQASGCAFVVLALFAGCGSQVNQSAAAAESNPAPRDAGTSQLADGAAPLTLTALAGDDRTVLSGESFGLDGSASRASNGTALRYEWRLLEGTLDQPLNNPDRALLLLTAPRVTEATRLVLQLVVATGGQSASDTVEITVLPVQPRAEGEGESAAPAEPPTPAPPTGPTRGADVPADGETTPDGPTDSGTAGGGGGGAPVIPVALAQRATAVRDRPVTITLAGLSADGVALSFAIETSPTIGRLSAISTPSPANFATVRYTPAAAYVGADSFTYVVSDGVSVSAPVSVGLTVVPPARTLPSFCTDVSFDAHGHFVINGDRAFPMGYHGIYGIDPNEGWDEFARGFNSFVIPPNSPPRNAAMAVRNLFMIAQSTLQFDFSVPGRPRIDSSATLAASTGRQIIAWEVEHEPQVFSLSDIRGDVAAQAAALRAADACQRPVVVMPSAGADTLYYVYSQHVDFTGVQFYPTPSLPLRTVGDFITRVQGWILDQPFVYLFRLEGYQAGRYRNYFREPTSQELRAGMYESIVHGASGVYLYNYSRGAWDRGMLGFPEDFEAGYNISDSPDLHAALRETAIELRRNAPLFLSEPSDIPIYSDNPDVRCRLWDVNGDLPGGEYLIAVNVSEDVSPFFEVLSGGEVLRPRAYVMTPDSRVFPRTECNDGIDNDGDLAIDLADPDCLGVEDESESAFFAPRQVRELSINEFAMKRITPPITDRTELINRVRMHFLYAPPSAGASARFAIYVDDWRDEAPGSKLYESDWLPLGSTPTWVDATLPEPIPLQPTLEYFLAFKVNRAGVYVDMQDVRYGARAKPGFSYFLDSYPPLLLGRAATDVHIPLPDGPFRRICAVRRPDQPNCDVAELQDGMIVDSFEPYGVHVYQLLP